jgi:hypothetical protein
VSTDTRPDVDGLSSRARWTQVALVVVAIVDLIAIASGYAEYRLLGSDYTIEEADANDLRQGAIGVVQFLLLIAAAVYFIRWFKLAYENVEPLGGTRRYGKGWAIGAWFVPILNLWRPKQIANDIWRTSERVEEASFSSLLTLWWLLFLAANWVSNAALRLSFSGETPEELQAGTAAYLVADSLDFVAALLAIWVVRTITRRQTTHAEHATGRVELAGAQP